MVLYRVLMLFFFLLKKLVKNIFLDVFKEERFDEKYIIYLIVCVCVFWVVYFLKVVYIM